MNSGTRGFYRAMWQDICHRPVKLLRCLFTLTLCVVFLFSFLHINHPLDVTSSDYFVYMKVENLSDSSRLIEHMLDLKQQYSFNAQLYCHVQNGGGMEVIGLEEADFFGDAPVREGNWFRVSDDLIPQEYNVRANEIQLVLNQTTYNCVGKAIYLDSDLLSTLQTDETRAETLDIALSVNPTMAHHDEIDVYTNKNAKEIYENFIRPFRPRQIFLTLESYLQSGLPVYGAALIFDRPLVGQKRADFLSAFDDVAYTEHTNITYNSLSNVKDNLDQQRALSSLRLMAVMTLFLFMQLVSWKIWIADLRRPMETFCLLGISYRRQQELLLGLFMLLSLVPFAAGTVASYAISALVLEPVMYLPWNMVYIPLVLVFYLAGLVLYSLYCLIDNVWRIQRKEVVL